MLEIVLKNKQKLVFAKCVFACLLFGVKVLVSIFLGYFLLFGRVGLRNIIFKCQNTPFPLSTQGRFTFTKLSLKVNQLILLQQVFQAIANTKLPCLSVLWPLTHSLEPRHSSTPSRHCLSIQACISHHHFFYSCHSFEHVFSVANLHFLPHGHISYPMHYLERRNEKVSSCPSPQPFTQSVQQRRLLASQVPSIDCF